MAIIIKCKKCKTRRETDAGPCPACGSTELCFILDYRPAGRIGIRRRKTLENVTDYKKALEYDRAMKNNLEIKRKPGAVQNINQLTATFGDLYEDYLKWLWLNSEKTEIDKKTHRNYEYKWKAMIKIIGDVPIAQFDDDWQTNYKTRRQAQKVCNKTINNELFDIAGFLKWCREEKKYNLEPVVIKKLKHNRPIPIILSPAEIIALVNVAQPYYKALYLCLYTIGWRFAEVQYLTWGDIDFENKTLRTRQKGGSFKVSVLNDWLKNALLMLKQGKHDEYVFKSPKIIIKNGKPQTMGNKPVVDIRHMLKSDATRAEIKKKVYPHLLRHSIATHLLSKNVNLRTIQLLLGHATTEPTEFYTHVVTGNIREATDDMFNKMSMVVSTPNKTE